MRAGIKRQYISWWPEFLWLSVGSSNSAK